MSEQVRPPTVNATSAPQGHGAREASGEGNDPGKGADCLVCAEERRFADAAFKEAERYRQLALLEHGQLVELLEPFVKAASRLIHEGAPGYLVGLYDENYESFRFRVGDMVALGWALSGPGGAQTDGSAREPALDSAGDTESEGVG